MKFNHTKSSTTHSHSIGRWIANLPERGDLTAIRYKEDDTWIELSWTEYFNKILVVAKILQNLKLKKLAHVGIMSETRWEWAAADLAILGSQLVTVPIYPNLSEDDLIYIINHSDIEVLFVEDKKMLKLLNSLKKKFEKEIHIFTLEDINFNQKVSSAEKNFFLDCCDAVNLKDVATIIYTSGTTGTPKGAVLLHEAITSEVTESFDLFQVQSSDTSLCFLPFSHVLGRIELWGSIYVGFTLSFAESIDALRQNLKEIKPQFLIAVPRVFEKIYGTLQSKLATQGIFSNIFNQAIKVAEKVRFYRETKQMIPWVLLLQHETLSKLVFAPIHFALGGRLKFAVSGGAPLSPEITKFFASCGIQILEGYGLTETCAAVAVNTLADNVPGTVGRPIGESHIRIADDGEILVKSKKCFVKYYKDSEATKAAFVDGYFKTGDIGEFTTQKYLKITDRKKELIKTSGGKYVVPQKLDNLLKLDHLISHVLVIGNRRKYVSVLLSLDEIQLKAWTEKNNINYSDLKEITSHPALRLHIQKTIREANSKLASFETIKKFEITSTPWTVENNLLTPSLKVKRKLVEETYQELIDDMYEG